MSYDLQESYSGAGPVEDLTEFWKDTFTKYPLIWMAVLVLLVVIVIYQWYTKQGYKPAYERYYGAAWSSPNRILDTDTDQAPLMSGVRAENGNWGVGQFEHLTTTANPASSTNPPAYMQTATSGGLTTGSWILPTGAYASDIDAQILASPDFNCNVPVMSSDSPNAWMLANIGTPAAVPTSASVSSEHLTGFSSPVSGLGAAGFGPSGFIAPEHMTRYRR